MYKWSPFLFALGLAGAAHAQDPGVSETLARDRASRVSNLRYDLSFSIPGNKTEAIKGHEAITFTLSDASAPLALDFARGQTGHLLYPASALHAGENRLVIDFDAGAAPLNRNDEFLYTIFVPARAHEATRREQQERAEDVREVPRRPRRRELREEPGEQNRHTGGHRLHFRIEYEHLIVRHWPADGHRFVRRAFGAGGDHRRFGRAVGVEEFAPAPAPAIHQPLRALFAS